jgi:hypothetical protein
LIEEEEKNSKSLKDLAWRRPDERPVSGDAACEPTSNQLPEAVITKVTATWLVSPTEFFFKKNPQ